MCALNKRTLTLLRDDCESIIELYLNLILSQDYRRKSQKKKKKEEEGLRMPSPHAEEIEGKTR